MDTKSRGAMVWLTRGHLRLSKHFRVGGSFALENMDGKVVGSVFKMRLTRLMARSQNECFETVRFVLSFISRAAAGFGYNQ